MRSLALFGAAAVLASALSASAQPFRPTGRYSADLEGCSRRGGRPAVGPFHEHYCKIPFSDRGRACTDVSQCAGSCVYGNDVSLPIKHSVVGACQAYNVKHGCYFTVRRGRAVEPVCGD